MAMRTLDFDAHSTRRRHWSRMALVVASAAVVIACVLSPATAQERETGGGGSGTHRPKDSGKKPGGANAPKPKFTTLSIVSMPAECIVSVDGVLQGTTDAVGRLELRVKRGTLRIQIERQGYRPVERVIEVKSSKQLHVPVTLEPMAGELSISATPTDASIVVDGVGEFRGPSVTRDVVPGIYAIEVARDGYRRSTRTVRVEPGSKAHIEVTLDEIPHRELLDEAELAFAASQYDRAMSICNGVLLRRPNNERALLVLGRSLYALRRYGESADALSRAMLKGAAESFGVKHVHQSRSGVTFCTGAMTVRVDSVEFRSSTSPACSFSLLKSSLRGSTYQAANGQRLVVRVAEVQGRKERLVDHAFHPTGASALKSAVSCPGCDESTFVLFRMIQDAEP